jgi:hypothetical protein
MARAFPLQSASRAINFAKSWLLGEIMSRGPRIGQLKTKRSELKSAGQFSSAIPLQLEIILMLQKDVTEGRELANAHNMASVLYYGAKMYSGAERHARQALALHSDESDKGHETLATYNFMMARILACWHEFEEATRFGELAISEFSHWHTLPDEFFSRVIAEVEAIRNRTWTAPE